jgi:drug/metabolite transporter (DMT)-like permease
VAIQVSGMVLMALVWLVSPQSLHDTHAIITMLVASIFFTIAYLSFIRGLAVGKAGIVVPLGNMYPLIVLLLTCIFAAVKFSHLQFLAIITVVAGAVLLGIERINKRQLHKSFSTEAAFGLLAAVFWGVGFYLENTIISRISWQAIQFVTAETMGVYALAIALVANRKNSRQFLKHVQQNTSGLLAGVLLALGAIAFYVGATKVHSVLIPAVIASGAPLITSLLAAYFDHERIILVKRFGAILVVAGIVLLNF